MEQVLRCPAVAAVALATAELILAIQKAFPAVRLVPCEPIEGEDIHLWAYLPMQAEEQLTIQDRSLPLNIPCKRNMACRRWSWLCQSQCNVSVMETNREAQQQRLSMKQEDTFQSGPDFSVLVFDPTWEEIRRMDKRSYYRSTLDTSSLLRTPQISAND